MNKQPMRSKFSVSIEDSGQREVIEYDDSSIIHFSDGTIQINKFPSIKYLGGQFNQNSVLIKADILDSDGIMVLSQIKNMLDTWFKGIKIDLQFNYLPYARYDRAMKENDSFSLKAFTDIINSMNFNRVLLIDPHSNVGQILLKNSDVIIDQLTAILLSNVITCNNSYDYIVSPDFGAIKKATSISEYYNIPLLIALKKRDVSTGYTVFDKLLIDDSVDLTDKKLLIVDDICDYGNTFINLAKGIKDLYNIKSIDLFVTHGLFSGGKKLNNIDNTYCFNDYSKSESVLFN
jgi:ribose-phosphate pyrophosphokinase